MRVRILSQVAPDDGEFGAAAEVATFAKGVDRPEEVGLSLARGAPLWRPEAAGSELRPGGITTPDPKPRGRSRRVGVHESPNGLADGVETRCCRSERAAGDGSRRDRAVG